MLTGQTHFLGMAFEQLKRLQLDIETYTTEGFEFPNPGRPGDRIIAIALSDQTGWERHHHRTRPLRAGDARRVDDGNPAPRPGRHRRA